METQLLTIGIPTITVLVGILLNSRWIDQTNQRITEIKTDLNSKIDTLRADLTDRIDTLRADIISRIDKTDAEVRVISNDLRTFYSVNAEHSQKILNLERKAS